MSERIVNVHPKQYNGKNYRSSLEAQTAQTLDEMGIPYSYEERKIELLQGFRTPFQKEKVRSITYTPDFIIGPIMLECKGFETPEWKIKKKLIFKYLQENEPGTVFYQIHDAKRQLLEALDNHWAYLGYAIEATPVLKGKKEPKSPRMFDSIAQAMYELNLQGKPKGIIASALTGKRNNALGYHWKLKKLRL